MFFLHKAYCRTYQAAFRLAQPILPYRTPVLLSSCTALGSVCQKEALSSLLIVTDPGVSAAGLVTPLTDVLQENHISYSVYDQTQPNPTVSNVEDALVQYQKHRCNGLIAIGGGSAIDCAKGVGIRVAYPNRTLPQLSGKLRVLRPLPTLIAIPTTAGTGSETTLAAVLMDTETHQKCPFMSFPLIPHYAVLDARLTLTLPPHVTASTGMDALTHAVEAYIGRATTKETRQLSLSATKLIFENLETAYQNGDDQTARARMLLAAHKAGIAFSKSYVGYAHAIAHTLGAQYGIPHGLANAVILPYVLQVYGDSVHKALHELGIAAGVCTPEESHAVAAKKFIRAIQALNASINLPCKLTGIQREDIPLLARHAEQEANPLYPVPKLLTQAELTALYIHIADWRQRP